MAIVILIVGYVAGLFAASNILLPIFWAWPKARTLQRNGRLFKPIPATRFVAPATFWTALLATSAILIGGGMPPDDGTSYLFGVFIGTLQTGRLIFNPNADMEADFKKTYEAYLQVPSLGNR